MKKIFVVVLLVGLGSGSAADILLFGGSNREVFLGCFNCGRYASDSICNPYGSYGSRYSSTSIFNDYARFGNEYNLASPWNEYSFSDSVPILLNRAGVSYGYFTINRFRTDASAIADELYALYNLVDGDLEKFQEQLCEMLE